MVEGVEPRCDHQTTGGYELHLDCVGFKARLYGVAAEANSVPDLKYNAP